MPVPMVTRSRLHDVADFPTDTHLHAPALNHGRCRTGLTTTLSDPTRPAPVEDSSRCDRRLGKSHDAMLRAVVTFVAGRRRGDWLDRSHVRTRAQPRAEVECRARTRSSLGPAQIVSEDNAALGCAPLIPDAFPGRLRPSLGTSPNTTSVHPRRNPQLVAPDSFSGPGYPSQRHWSKTRTHAATPGPTAALKMHCRTIVGSVICSHEHTPEARADERGRTVRPYGYRDFAVKADRRRHRDSRVLGIADALASGPTVMIAGSVPSRRDRDQHAKAETPHGRSWLNQIAIAVTTNIADAFTTEHTTPGNPTPNNARLLTAAFEQFSPTDTSASEYHLRFARPYRSVPEHPMGVSTTHDTENNCRSDRVPAHECTARHGEH